MTPEERLAKLYRDAIDDLLDKIRYKKSNRYGVRYEEIILKQLTKTLRLLDAEAERWVVTNVPAAYLEGELRVYNRLTAVRAGLTRPELLQPNHPAIRVAVDNTRADLRNANLLIGRSVQDALRDASVEAVAQGLAVAETYRETAKRLEHKLAVEGISAFRDAGGKTWRPSAYARMVAITTRSEATNSGTMSQMQGLGFDLVRVTSHANPCPVCAPFENRVFSISGTSPIYPPLASSVFTNGFKTIHPNCRHRLTPVIEELRTAEEEARDLELNRRPLDVDPRSERQRRAYAAEQKRKRDTRAAARLYEKYRALLADEMPATFASFASIRKADGAAWRDLKRAYRRAVRQLGG